jgi:hypothetical protein
MSALYAVFLGGEQADMRLGEDHEVVFVVADDDAQARARGKANWSGRNNTAVHVDSLARIERVDGFDVRLIAASEGDRVVLHPKYSS